MQQHVFDETNSAFFAELPFSSFSHPQKGFSMMPKQCVDVHRQEISRAVRLTNNNQIEYASFRVPNRTGVFNEELYPDFPAPAATNNFANWAAGQDTPAQMMRLRPDEDSNNKATSKARLSIAAY